MSEVQARIQYLFNQVIKEYFDENEPYVQVVLKRINGDFKSYEARVYYDRLKLIAPIPRGLDKLITIYEQERPYRIVPTARLVYSQPAN